MGEVDKKFYQDDGSITSIIRTQRDYKKVFNQVELLEIHGFDPKEFRIRSITSNEWTIISSTSETGYNYQSKIVAEPLAKNNSLKDILEAIKTYTKPFDITCIDEEKLPDTLLINLPDLHFGLNTADEYTNYQSKILSYLENQYQNIIITLLGDLFHADNFKSTTIHDTRVDDTDIPNAWEEATLFLEPIIQKALAMSPNVDIIYLKGNHDETISWAFAKYLETKYPQCGFDVKVDQLKCVSVDDNAIFLTHGHVNRKNIGLICATLYPDEWAKSSNRLLFTGHYHSFKASDLTGLIHYQLPTPSKHTKYEEEKLYLGNQKGIHLFELGQGKVNAIYYL